MDDSMMTNFRNNEAAQRFELKENGGITFADYRLSGRKLMIDHVETPPAMRGQGAAGRLMQQITDYAKSQNLEIIPICSYAAAWVRRNKLS